MIRKIVKQGITWFSNMQIRSFKDLCEPCFKASEFEVLRFKRVMFCVTASPFLLGGTIRHHLMKYDYDNEDPEFVCLMLEPLYVDDVDAGGHDVNEAFELYVKSTLRFQ